MKQILVICVLAAALPSFTNGFLTKDNTLKSLTNYKVPDEQIICIKDGVSRIIADNGNIQQWLKEVERAAVALINEVKRCEAISSSKKSTCFLRLQSSSLSELGRVVNLITKDMVDSFDKISDTVVECLLTKSSPETRSNFLSSNHLTRDFQITDKQIKCISNVIAIVIEHNRDLQWWFTDIGNTLITLIIEARDCALLSGDNRIICIVKLKILVSVEVQRIAESLPNDKQAVGGLLKSFIEGCFL